MKNTYNSLIISLQAFFNEDYIAKNPQHKQYMDELKELIVDQVKRLHYHDSQPCLTMDY